jgi:hypothetical protein
LYAFLVSAMHCTCPAHLILLYLVTLIISHEAHKLWSFPLCSLLFLSVLSAQKFWMAQKTKMEPLMMYHQPSLYSTTMQLPCCQSVFNHSSDENIYGVQMLDNTIRSNIMTNQLCDSNIGLSLLNPPWKSKQATSAPPLHISEPFNKLFLWPLMHKTHWLLLLLKEMRVCLLNPSLVQVTRDVRTG